MTPIENVLSKVTNPRRSGNGWSARCPNHQDQKASLSISEGDGGKVLITCFARCTLPDILNRLGLKMADLFPRQDQNGHDRNGHTHHHPKPKPSGRTFSTCKDAVAELERQHGKRSAWWTYHDAQGEPIGVVVRWDKPDGKDIRPVARHADGWRIGAMPDPRPLYKLPDLSEAKLVLVVEGEKAADAARALGYVATTSAGGSSSPNKTDWTPLAGKEVWILPDHDTPGRKYATEVASILAKLSPAPVVRIVELPNLPDKGDLVDWIDAHGDKVAPNAMRAEIEAFAHEVDPLRPVEVDDMAYREFPVGSLPDPIRGFVDAGARALGCDPSYLALPLLVALGAAIGNTRRLQLKRGWYAPPVLWGAIIGESGTLKTPAFKLVMKPVREHQQKASKRYAEELKKHETELLKWEKALTTWKRLDLEDDPPPKPDPPIHERFTVSDTTVEALAPILQENPRGVLLARDELAGWIGSFDRYAAKGKTGADSANWLSMFNAETITVDRKTGTPRTIHVPQAAVCIAGGIQPGILQRALGQEHRESGLAARLLLAYPPRKPKRWTEADIDPREEAELTRLFEWLYELQPATDNDGNSKPALVHLDPDAKAAWKAYYNDHAAEQADLTGDLAAAWSKLEEYAARLALVIHCVRVAFGDTKDENRLDVASMNAGIALTEWFKHEAKRIYTMIDESDADRDLRRLVEWIDRKDGTTTLRKVQQGCRWLKEPGAAEAALDSLAKAGRGQWHDPPTTSKGGRSPRVFTLSPASTSTKPQKPRVWEGFVDVDTVDTSQNTETEDDPVATRSGPKQQGTGKPDSLFDDSPPTGHYAHGL